MAKKFLKLNLEPTESQIEVAVDSYASEVGVLIDGSAATSEEIKTDIQNLTDAANAKTGKSDANLTDAVNTLLEGYGQGGGDCPINIVDELPAVGVEGEIVGVKTFADVFMVHPDMQGMMTSQLEAESGLAVYLYHIPSMAEFQAPPSGGFGLYYITEKNDIITSNGLSSLSETFGVPFKGEITDVSQATEDGYYAYMKLTLYQYTNGEFKELVPKSDVLGLRKFNSTINKEGLEHKTITNDEYDVASDVLTWEDPIECDLTTSGGEEYKNIQLLPLDYDDGNNTYKLEVQMNFEGYSEIIFLGFGVDTLAVINGTLANSVVNVKYAGKYEKWLLANTTPVE